MFLRGGVGAKDGQPRVGAQPWSKKQAGKELGWGEAGQAGTEQEQPAAANAAGAAAAWTERPAGESAGG